MNILKRLALGLGMSAMLTFNSFASTTLYCTGTHVNIRSGPSLDSNILDQANINFTCEGIEEKDGWWKISTCDADKYAYMCSNYLSTEPVPEKSYTEDDLWLMAHALAGECQSYPDDEQIKVGSVILNRVKSAKFPNTIKEVLFQRKQYSCVTDGNFYREPTDRNWANARYLLEKGSELPEKVVYQSGKLIGKLYLKTKYHSYGF